MQKSEKPVSTNSATSSTRSVTVINCDQLLVVQVFAALLLPKVITTGRRRRRGHRRPPECPNSHRWIQTGTNPSQWTLFGRRIATNNSRRRSGNTTEDVVCDYWSSSFVLSRTKFEVDWRPTFGSIDVGEIEEELVSKGRFESRSPSRKRRHEIYVIHPDTSINNHRE